MHSYQTVAFHLQEHLFLVCELLRANLYEFQKYNRESGDPPYFTNARIQRIARQVSMNTQTNSTAALPAVLQWGF